MIELLINNSILLIIVSYLFLLLSLSTLYRLGTNNFTFFYIYIIDLNNINKLGKKN